jgi:hypothetical protein
MSHDEGEADARALADVAALADGSLPARREAEVRARVLATPEGRRLLAAHERAVDAVRAARATAPAGLRERVERRRAERRRIGRRLAAAAAAAAAAGALVGVLVLAGGSNGPSLSDAAALGTRPASAPAPRVAPDDPVELVRRVGEVPFPNWRRGFGWRASGARVDAVRGRTATTVFYRRRGARLAYTILAGDPIDVPGGAVVRTIAGRTFHGLRLGGRGVVVWTRRGHSCVLSAGRRVPRAALLALAAWRAGGALPY